MWESAFDEAHPEPGATAAELRAFVQTVSLPLMQSEIRACDAQEQNPFPTGDPTSAVWRPRRDASTWHIPDRPLPAAYLDLLSWSDGGDFRKGRRWFQFFPALDDTHGVRAMLLAYALPRWMPGALPFAMNGGGVFYLLDMRNPASGGEYPIVCAAAGNLGWDPTASRAVARSLEEVCRGTENVEDCLFDSPEAAG